MSHIRVKTEYNVETEYGALEKRTLYAHHNNTCDVVTFYDENGKELFSFDDTIENNLMDAINRLCIPHNSPNNFKDGVEYMNAEDRSKCGYGI